MRYIEYYESQSPEDFLEQATDVFLPELERISRRRNSQAFVNESDLFGKNFLVFILSLGTSIDLAGEACMRNVGKLPEKVRIEMRTFDGFVIRMRFVSINEKGEPYLREVDNPIFLIFSDQKYFKKFKREGYSTITEVDFVY